MRSYRKPAALPYYGAFVLLAVLLALSLWYVLGGPPNSPAGNTWTAQPIAEARQTPSLALAGDGESSWYLRLVNTAHPLPEDWAPALSTIDEETGEQFDSRAVGSLQAMLAAMREEGLHPLVCSGYRPYQAQADIFQENVSRALEEGFSQEEAWQQASLWVTPPGCSEHQLGLAADIVAKSNQNLDETQEGTPEQQWLLKHCQEYGFILRYPPDKTQLTGVNYEPWHYRYVGTADAQEIMGRGLCLEEYGPAGQAP